MSSPMRTKGTALKSETPPRAAPYAAASADAVAVALTGAVLAVQASEPVVAVVPAERAGDETLPCGSFLPGEHRTLEGGVRSWVQSQTGVELGFLEQLCTLGLPSRSEIDVPHLVSVSYLALVGPQQCNDRTRATWRSWYSFFPWEDWRNGRPACLTEIEQRLESWAAAAAPQDAARWMPDRRQRVRIAFSAGTSWDEEKVAERYELLRDAEIVGGAAEDATGIAQRLPRLVHSAVGDQSLVLARAIGELRRAIKCRPIVFELMHAEFTLFELQKAVEAILGPHLHKQNFRRLVEGCGLVEPTGELRLRTGGRPAQLYRFRRDVVYEHAAPGVRLKPGRM
jgi:hypothetical protein